MYKLQYTGDEVERLLENASKITNKNLLHNWDFRNPVNQRGASSYSSAGYSIDRWRLSGSQTLSVTSGYIQLTTTNTGVGLEHYIENGHLLAGEPITLSAEVKGNYRISAFRFRSGSFTSICNLAGDNADFSVVSVSGTVMTDFISTDALVVIIRCNNTGGNAQFKSVKLELGSVSTLANDPPADYGEQLALCQRYFATVGGYPRFRASRVSANGIETVLPLVTTLRATPTIISGNLKIVNLSGDTTYTGFTFTVRSHENGVTVIATKTGHGLSDALLFVDSGGVQFSADL